MIHQQAISILFEQFMGVSCFSQNKSEGRLGKQKGKGGQILCYVQSTVQKGSPGETQIRFPFYDTSQRGRERKANLRERTPERCKVGGKKMWKIAGGIKRETYGEG